MDETLKKEDIQTNEKKIEFSSSNFEILEREFNDVLEDLDDEPSLSQFRVEYEKLFRALKKSHHQEKRLVKKCRELNTEIVTNAAKVQTAIKLSQDDQATIATLKKDAERAWTLVDDAQEKGIRANNTINQLEEEAKKLSIHVEDLQQACTTNEKKVKELNFECNGLKVDLEKKNSSKNALESKWRDLNKANQLLTKENDSLQESLDSVKNDNYRIREELKTKEKIRNDLDKQLGDIKIQFQQKSLNHDELSCTISITKKKIAQLEMQLSEAKCTMEKYLKDYDVLYQRERNLAIEYEENKKKSNEISNELQNLQQQLKLATSDQLRMASEKKQFERKVDQSKKNLERYQRLLDDNKASYQMAQNEIHSLKREIDQFKKQEDENRRYVDKLNQEKNLHLNSIQRKEDKAKRIDNEMQQQEQLITSLQKEILVEREKSLRLTSDIRRFEHTCEKLELKVAEQSETICSTNENIKVKDTELHDLKNELYAKQNDCKQQSHQFDEMRRERNRFSQQLIEINAEKEEMKNKLYLMTQNEKQMRNELMSKEAAMVKEHFDWKREKSQGDQHRNEISRLKSILQQNNDSIHKQDIEIKRYESLVRKMKDDAFLQRKEYDQIINERDILGTQLIRRNDELALLYEKLKILQNTLRNGEMQYQERIEDIRLLKLKIKDLQRQVTIVKGGVINIDGITKELIQKNRELLREKTKVKALSEELENPLNVHRWRKLEGSDPATYEMIQKIQILQRRLIKKTEEVSDKLVM